MKNKSLFVALLFIFTFLTPSLAVCNNCASVDCSNDCVSDTSGYCLYCGGVYGCAKISNENNPAACYASSFIICNSSNLEKPSNDASFGSAGFTLNGNPYYCTNYNQTGNYVWKTCYSGALDPNWYSVQLACSGGTLYECTDKSGISGTVKGDCDSISVNNQKLYCDSSIRKWVKPEDVKERCPGACGDVGGTWTGSACCDGTDDYVDSSKPANACDDGVVKICGSTDYPCGSAVDIEGTTYYCDGTSWTAAPDPDSCSGLCTALGYQWDDTNRCCDDPDDNFLFSDSSKICDDGSVYVCSDGNLCTQREGYFCIKDDAGDFAWSKNTCSSSGACINGTWDSRGCDVLDGWYNYGNTSWCGDDPTAEYRDYTCSGTCIYSPTNTKDCDSLDGWYGGGNVEGCGDDPAIEHRDYYVNSNGDCVYYVCETNDTCDSYDECQNVCISEQTLAGGRDYYWDELNGGGKPASCSFQLVSSTDCTLLESVDSDGGDNPWTAGSVTDYERCKNGECVGSVYTDTCRGVLLIEYIGSGNSYTTREYNCSSFSTCGIETTCVNGACANESVDPDSSRRQCELLCNHMWMGTSCCGDDPNEIYRTSNIDSTAACCDSVSDCVLESACYDSGKFSTDSSYYCDSGSWKTASPDCAAVYAGGWYFALNGKWVGAAQANATCENACYNISGEWISGTVLQGFACCVDSSQESLVNLTGDQAICNGSTWLKASEHQGEIVPTLPYYLSTGNEWKKCVTVGEEVTVGGVIFVCTEHGWQNKECAQQGDLDSTICEQNCGGTWLGLGGSKNCCGNSADDEFLIDSARICDGVAGVKTCTQNCEVVEFSNGTKFYCFEGKWEVREDFKGNYYREFQGSGGCCAQDQCWKEGCVASGYVEGELLCAAGEWRICNFTSVCSSITLPQGVFYCTDTGWDVVEPITCNASRGVCIDDACKLCGLDYEIGEVVKGLMCTSQGIFSTGCLLDSDCKSSGECVLGRCINGQCVFENLACGTPCSSGVCDGSGKCVPKAGKGGDCKCQEMCGSGLACVEGVCEELETCGDGVCDPGECSACPSDCSLQDCIGNGVCDIAIGENCENSMDCRCGVKVCNPSSPVADAWGCVATACGNGLCEGGECSSCPSDCSLQDCIGNGVCDIAIGENCENSMDCRCEVKVEYDEVPVLEPGEEKAIKIFAENTGNVPLIVNLNLSGEGIEVKGGERLFLQPGEKRETTVVIKALESGAKKIEVYATSDKGELGKAGEVQVIVRKLAPWEVALRLLSIPLIRFLLDFKELIAMLIAGGALLWRKISKPRIVSPYRYPNLYTYPSQNYGAVYPQSMYQYRRGYYRW